MKFRVSREGLVRATVITSRLATNRATLPILQNLYLEATKKGLVVKATDLEQTLEVELRGEVERLGSITVPARLLVEYLQNNADNEVALESKETTLLVKSVNHQAQIKGLPAEEYPTVPEIKADQSVSLDASLVASLISRTVFAAANDETRPILNSLLWRFQDKTLTVVGTDGYRLAHYKVPIERDFVGDYVLPKRTIQELSKLLGEGELEMLVAGNQVKFLRDGTCLTSRILEGAYPAFEGILPKQNAEEASLSSSTLLQSLRLASLFSRDSAYSTKLVLDGQRLTIAATSPQVGENTNEVALKTAAKKPITVNINAQYLIDVLAVVSGEVKLGLTDAKSPVVVQDTKDDRYLYLVMPLRSE